ncbi:hypothetical protein COV20_02400 [Candidatus Woesearchaeota archaeon CG10_big_fil_rev_8_21_14_0_10_45_16]|nr:MAG: hypothetical protein COV20_02400 [Candidatus Woesearchaeota archaeon CG10_big_fil_rev_8_21_14_0_10_45_16]
MKKRHGPWIVEATKNIYSNNWLKVYEDDVIGIAGEKKKYSHISIRNGSHVIPVDNDNNVYLAEEFRYGAGEIFLEVIAGGIEEGEEPLETAKRELKEELGITAERFIDLGVIDPLPSHSFYKVYPYLALDLALGEQQLDANEEIKIVKMPLTEAVKKALDGTIKDALSALIILRAARYLEVI